MEESGRRISFIRKTINTIIMAILSLVILVPMLYILIVSVSDQSLYTKNLFSFMSKLRLDNYTQAWEQANIKGNGMNTLIVAFIAIVILVISASLCAFAIKFFHFKEIGMVYYIIIISMFIPIQAIILPLFMHLKNLHLLNSLSGLGLVYATVNLPMSFMMFSGYYKSIPTELDEAAKIDGCSSWGVYFRIILPLSKSIIATVIILAGLNIWRDFFIPLVTLTDTTKYTLGVGLLSFRDEFSTDWTKMFAAIVIQSLPLILLFLSLQKYFIKGVVSGSVKG